MKQLKALSFVYKVLHFAETNPSRRGFINYDDREIVIDPNQSKVRYFETLIHEIVHLVKNINGDLNQQSEDETTRFATILTTILLENPDLLKLATSASRALKQELE